MGSVKDLIIDDSVYGRHHIPATMTEFGVGAWRVKGTYSVGDLKFLLADSDIKNKAEAITMTAAKYYEELANKHPEIKTCYLGLLDRDGKIVDIQTLLDRGDTTNVILMKLANVPDDFPDMNLTDYRNALNFGELKCAVADVESIFRKGLPLGSSTFERIFKAANKSDIYNSIATYDEVYSALRDIRATVNMRGVWFYPKLESLLEEIGLDEHLAYPGYIMKDIIFDSTTKFEEAGDRPITKEEERILSGLSDEGYEFWTQDIFPKGASLQVDFGQQHGLFIPDGKGECVSYHGLPYWSDFALTVDENRLMIVVEIEGIKWAIPSNKEIARAKMRQAGVYLAIADAKQQAKNEGDIDKWRNRITSILNDRNINLKEISDDACILMGYATAEVSNRILGTDVFDTTPIDRWKDEFMLFASKIYYQE